VATPAELRFWPKSLPYGFGPYRCVVDRIVDADTLVVMVDCGLGQYPFVAVRISGVDAPEIGTPEGKAARAWLEEFVPPGSPLLLRTHGRSFERWVGSLLAHDGKDLASELVRNGYATWVREA
jgi:endonuclease YncB( thermonuclease family)